MASESRAATGNRLIQSLMPRDRALLARHLVPIDLPLRHMLERANKPIQSVFFPEMGIASVVAQHPHGRRIEIGIIGSEGMSGSAIVLGNERSPHETYMQIGGAGYRMPAATLRRAMKESRSLHTSLLRYVHSFMVQTAHSAITNARARLSERLARWLLMAHDRVPGNVLSLTHEFLALMMAVRRPSVTETLALLEGQRLIKCGHGEIIILSRKGLEKVAGYFYGTPESEYRRLMCE
jgi:CRP-like cAMP-binding protein